jgi:predicted phage terminase large subunit-like protein
LAHNCHILIIDDPIKNMEEADSADRRLLIDEWYQSTASTRVAPGGGILLIETWWSWDDLAGRLQQRMRLDPMADQFEVVLYPALSTTYEYRDESSPRHEIIRTAEPIKDVPERYTLLRGIDTALHEERYSTHALKKIRANLQPRIWSALYQQAPTPDEGLYFRKEHFRFEHLPPLGEHVNYYTAWDFAIGLKQQNDYTVGATVAHDDYDHAYVPDIVRFKGDSFEIVDSIVTVAERYMRISGGRYVVGVEDGQIWRSIEPLLRKRMDERKVFPTIEVMKPLTDKVARARPLQGRMQQGKVSFPMDPPWKTELLQEMLQFPGGGHDDIVDALAWAIRLITNAAPPRLPDPPKVPSWRDKILNTVSGGNLTHMTS